MTTAFAELRWRERDVRVEYTLIAPERSAAPLLVFLHEGLGSLSMWRDFPARVCEAGGFRGLVYSRPGYGLSTPRANDERWGLDFMHQQAHEVLPALFDALAITEPPWLFGHSDGASIALLHAARFPTAGVVVLAPHLFVEDLSVSSITATRAVYVDGNLRGKLARYHEDPDSAFWGWNDIWLTPAFRAWNIEAELATIRCPVLAVQGIDDEYGTLAQIRRIAEILPHTELLELPDCGHSPQRDQAEKTIKASVSFITHEDRRQHP